MHDALAVRVLESLASRDQQMHRLRDLEPLLPAQKAGVVLALDELHKDERLIALEADVEDGDDVGMIQRRRGSCLSQELLAGLGASSQLTGEDLVGDLPLQQMVVSHVDRAHTPPA